MSVVAWKDGVMAADSKAYGGSNCYSPGRKTKIHRLDDGSLIGLVSSTIGGPEEVLDWVRRGMPIEENRARTSAFADFILIRPNGAMFLAVAKDRADPCFVSGPIKSRLHAIGSGAELALGAMHAGLSAEAAVGVACKVDYHCARPIHSLRL